MLEINVDDISRSYEEFRQNVKNGKTFAVTGLTSVLRLFLLSKIKAYSKKKVLFITSTEQNALKYQSDLSSGFNIQTEVMPFQNISMYDTVSPNLYDYAQQIKILQTKPDIVICPVKSLLEKFPNKEFFKKNSFKIKVGDNIDLKELAQRLVELGYKKSTMVNDISEFSIRGDIADIFSPDNNPVRIELWGDEVVDIRYFNNETQKSIEKIKEINILPVYKFILEGKENLLKELQAGEDEIPDESYFDGIEVYQNYFNKNLVSILDYFEDYILVFDETTEIYSKFEFLDDNFNKQLEENLKLNLIKPIEGKNHFTYEEFLRKTSYFTKVGFNNFIDSGMGDLIEFNSQPLRNFEADLDLITDFILDALAPSGRGEGRGGYKIIIATDYPERVKEILKEKEIFAVNFTESIVLGGCILEDFKTIVMTDRELFNKRSKEITSSKKSYFKEKPEFIENINDIKPGEFVVHTIHGLGIYKGLSKQEIDGQLKDYLTIEYANKDRKSVV